MRFITPEEANTYFNENYKSSEVYKGLTELAMSGFEIYSYMKHNKDRNYTFTKRIFESLVK